MAEKMSLAEALSTGLQTTVIGLVIVFAVLIVLMLVLVAMKYIFAPKNEEKPAADNIDIIPVQKQPEEDEEELIAVLTAAVAASLNTSTYNLKIKSYRRIGNNAPAWNKAGLNETIQSRY